MRHIIRPVIVLLVVALFILAAVTAMAQARPGATARKTYQHTKGFSFEYPAGWTVQEAAEFVQLVPPGANAGDSGENEAYRFLTDTVAMEATDPRFAGEMDKFMGQLPGFRRAGATENYQTSGGAGVRGLWTGKNLDTGAAVHLRMYATTSNGLAIVLFAAGKAELLTARDGALREIAASVTPARAPAAATQSAPTTGPGADKSPLAQQWARRLSGKKLVQLSSYNSGGGGGGMSSKTEIALGADGRMQGYSESSVSINVPGATGGSGGTQRAAGRWRIYAQNGQAILEIKYDNGQTESNQLEERNGQTLINGKRWFVTEQ
ncbi:MAG: hypothetical protein ACKV2V_22920 [Blastocatellia bacterium]